MGLEEALGLATVVIVIMFALLFGMAFLEERIFTAAPVAESEGASGLDASEVDALEPATDLSNAA